MVELARDALIESIASVMFQHRLTVIDNRSACTCGWWVVPLLDSVHRLHVADAILASTLMATAQINAENIAEATSQYRQLLEDCQQRLLET